MRHENEAGFTLVEILFAIVILAFGLLGIAMMQAGFAEGNTRSQQLISATDVAMAKIEELSRLNHWDGDLEHDIDPSEVKTHTDNQNFLPYMLSWTTQLQGDHLVVDLTVSWTAGGVTNQSRYVWIKD